MATTIDTAERDRLEREYREACFALKSSGAGSCPGGLTPDGIKSTPEYQRARLARDRAFDALRAFNRAKR